MHEIRKAYFSSMLFAGKNITSERCLYTVELLL